MVFKSIHFLTKSSTASRGETLIVMFPKLQKTEIQNIKNQSIPKLVNTLYLCKKKLRVIAKKILRDFWEKHGDCEQQLKAWFSEALKAEWENPN